MSPRPLFDKKLIELSRWLADYYLCPWVTALQGMLPAGLELTGRLPQNAVVVKYRLRSPETALKLTEKQQKVHDHLLIHKEATENELLTLGVSKDILKRMTVKDLLIRSLAEIEPYLEKKSTEAVIFTPKQENIYQAVLKEMRGEKRPYLLFGVTAGGKTEIYLRLIQTVVDAGKQCIFLVPEIALTNLMVDFLRKRLNMDIAVLHSGLTMSERRLTWQRIADGKYSVVLGARSAVFAPLKNLGLIIMDEEHDFSYKQDISPRFHARAVAKIRCRISGAQLVLGSATPAVESYYQAETGAYALGILNERYYPANLPDIEIVDMREELRDGNRSMISRKLVNELALRLECREQSMLLLNRRGYYTFYSCRECGEAIICPHCDIPLVYHEDSNVLRCHYCGYSENLPECCPVCSSKAIRHFGAGTERLVRELHGLFPKARIARLDLDSVRTRGMHQTIYRDMTEGRTDILVGTQMIAKGMDFPKVTLAGVLAADSTLNLPDWRAGERTYQLLTQLTGRAGRRDKQGLAVIQTYNPSNPVIQAVCKHDYPQFYGEELQFYRDHGYPPFFELIRLVVNAEDQSEAFKSAELLASLLAREGKEYGEICGPAKPLRDKIRDRYRYQILIKSNRADAMKHTLKNIEESIRKEKLISREVLIQIDVDPYDIM